MKKNLAKPPARSGWQTVKLPKVAIIGRPNVGKSTLINRIIGARESIVDDQPGVTRDRTYHPSHWKGNEFVLIDTGGLVPDAADLPEMAPGVQMELLVNTQVECALAEADVLIFVVDGQAGITAVDSIIAQQLRTVNKPLIIAANKIDQREQLALAAEFYELGLGEPLALSAMHGTGGVGDLLDAIVNALPDKTEDDYFSDSEKQPIRLAMVGRPNVGKSSLLNTIAGEERTIVSAMPGTTRDAIDLPVEVDGQPFILVDTAGIRKKGKVDYGVELFSVDRSIRAMRNADVTLVVLDAQEGVTDQDKKIIESSNEAGNGLILLVNKWDLVGDKDSKTMDRLRKDLMRDLPHARFAPMLFTSALTGQHVNKVFPQAVQVFENCQRRIQTSLVNKILMEAIALTPPHGVKSRFFKLLYATQAGASPPTFILFGNDAKLLKPSYHRYLENKLREAIEFTGTPIRLIIRSRGDKES